MSSTESVSNMAQLFYLSALTYVTKLVCLKDNPQFGCYLYIRCEGRKKRGYTEKQIKEAKFYFLMKKPTGTAVPLEAWSGPERSRRFRLPDFHYFRHV
jgi:hypothetical protein